MICTHPWIVVWLLLLWLKTCLSSLRSLWAISVQVVELLLNVHWSPVASLHSVAWAGFRLHQVLLLGPWPVQLDADAVALSVLVECLIACFCVVSLVLNYHVGQRIRVVAGDLVVKHAAALGVSSAALVVKSEADLRLHDRAISLVLFLLATWQMPTMVGCA